ncbi:RNA-binding domain-containing protein [Kineococcus sp. R86509]|uniref:RNA-binding domain-containing protein n=1 Tax=Kineococcus sp. R86509 TaxID=3093851 RepID=UPI0036D2EB85
MVDEQEVRQWLSLGTESRSFEVKGPGLRTQKAYAAKVARAVMAMGNLRGGGLVCLGIDDKQLAQMSPGLNAEQLKQWSDVDEVNVALSRYIEPPADVRVHLMELQAGVHVVVLEVHEFFDVPHLCRQDFPGEVQRAHLYVRPRGKAESTTVPTATDMRELIDLAVEKGLGEFLRRAQGAGLGLPGGQSPTHELTSIADTAYQSEYEQAWASPSDALKRMQVSAAYFDVAIRPRPYLGDRFESGQLEKLVNDLTVRLRGWPLPFVDDVNSNPPKRYGQWVGQETIIRNYSPGSTWNSDRDREAWRLWCSGQFLHRRVLISDERPDIPEAQASLPGATGTVVGWDVLLYLVEVAEFASRLAAVTGCDGVDIEVGMHNVQGRQLVSGDDHRVDVQRMMSANTLHGKTMASRPELVTQTRRVGVRLAQTLLKQFGLQVPDGFLMDWQDEVLQ